ncbi:MAG TPA: CDP-alcohol phosphatidyltransferase family protein, partial [Kofleriaceae bacterium]|nr:CDP-alcohol phosphatidyltransferase family protein [Kofleriaceae bacterium]
GGLLLFAAAARTHSQLLNFWGLAVYWVLDILDGWLARRLDQETRLGAQFDILSDRLLVAFFYFNYLHWHPGAALPVLLFLTNFMVLDHFLSNQFLRWPILSPNYFHEVDRVTHLLNWSPLGKAINSGLVTVLLAVLGWHGGAIAICAALIAVKGYSIARLHRLGGVGA